MIGPAGLILVGFVASLGALLSVYGVQLAAGRARRDMGDF